VSVLAVERREGWVLLALDRPDKRNALSIELRDALSDALDGAAADETVHGVAVTGRGPVFSAGWDLGEFTSAAEDAELMERIWQSGDRFHRTLLSYPLPLVAALQGPALAGGFDLAVCCDVRIASTELRFAHPERTWTEVLYSPVEALVGSAVARDLLFTGRELDAAAALRLGLVSEVVPPERLPALLDETMARVAEVPREILVKTKAKVIRRAGIVVDETLDL
jgi:enoyl-CoA hydratase